MSLETRAFTIAEHGGESRHVGDPRLCRVPEGTPPSVKAIRQLDVRSGSSTCHIDEPVRCNSSYVSVETAPLDIIRTNGAQKAQDSLGETIVSFVSLRTVFAGNKLEKGHIRTQQLLKCIIVARQEALPQGFDMS